ncbi:MAG: hypothetical protein MUO88_23625 [Desulfobacterales bacterium]|jgi:hypothetical protein|nr:hypothetical protein [Desulfobacterales bacterium]
MVRAQILIVEDDAIVAMDLETRLKILGYSVPAIVAIGTQRFVLLSCQGIKHFRNCGGKEIGFKSVNRKKCSTKM